MAPSKQPSFNSVIIVGAGPSGLLLALCLATLDPRPEITILDAAETLNRAPRATHYGTPAIKLFRKVGILAEMRRDGYMPRDVCWRKLDCTRITGLSWDTVGKDLDSDAMTVYPVGDLAHLLERELRSRADVKIRWGCKVSGIKSGLDADDETATVEFEEGGESKQCTADYVVGTDGGNSTIRRLVFGKRNFPGHSWEEQIVATNTEIDLDQFGFEDSNFIIHPVHFYMAARIKPDLDPKKNVWRISYGELPGLSTEELMERLPMKFEQILPGSPKPDEYCVLNKSPYRVHQRCVDSMRINRVMLAADAAHLCNPFGGMGLTGGIADISALFQCLEGMHKGLVDDSILSTWSDVQRKKWHEIIDPISSSNIRRLFAQDPDKALEQDGFLQMLKRSEENADLQKELHKAGDQLLHDYTQYFQKSGTVDKQANVANGGESAGLDEVAS
ncbi:hypothetical protein LTR37_009482 [Vermiconidia calcicola]|uniref:Uncharacterized protein n=1 Tax=Vermiconidia calcicola TaxID=1690605 RepID=A0ACC3N7M3_9PEZI|nr:hypothetical protein LTR37_009482 [Vermiconidia calcicola]